MKAVIASAVLLLSSPAGAWDKVYDGTGVERFTEKAGKLWTLPGLSSSTDRGASWSAGYDGGGTLDSDVSDDGREAVVLPQNYLSVTAMNDEESAPVSEHEVAAWGVRFLGRSVMAMGSLRDSEGDDGVLLSNDNGATWTPALMGKLSWRVRPYVLDEKRAWICAGEDVPVVWRTTDGGKGWERSSASKPLFGACDEMFFLDKKRGWAAVGSGPARTVYATDDGGDEWESRGTISLSTAGAVSLAFADKKRGWAAAPGAFWTTTDGGATWTPAPAPPTAILPYAAALRYVEERGRGWLLYGTARSEDVSEEKEEELGPRATRSRGEIWRMEAPAP